MGPKELKVDGNASRVTLYMTVKPSEARQETSITTALQSCDGTDTSLEPLGFLAFLRLTLWRTRNGPPRTPQRATLTVQLNQGINHYKPSWVAWCYSNEDLGETAYQLGSIHAGSRWLPHRCSVAKICRGKSCKYYKIIWSSCLMLFICNYQQRDDHCILSLTNYKLPLSKLARFIHWNVWAH